MNWLTKIFGGGITDVAKAIGNLADEFHLSGEEKQAFQLKLEQLLQQRDSEIEETIRANLQAKERILVAELTQGDTYTKRARPTVVYAGLLFVLFNYTVVPLLSQILSQPVPPIALPMEFWAGWAGIVATWSVGRTFEKRGAVSIFTKALTGSKHKSLLD